MIVCQCVFFPHVGLKERLLGELLEPGAGQVWLLDCGQGVSTQLTVGTNLATQNLRRSAPRISEWAAEQGAEGIEEIVGEKALLLAHLQATGGVKPLEKRKILDLQVHR